MEDYEKKYKEALGRANAKIETYNHLGNASVVKSICEIFPELKESKDERIRKEIIQFLQLPHPQFVGKRNQEKWIAWLEKQGEQTYFQKQEWTGYDEKAYEIALLDIDKSPSITKNDTIDWLKSLKNRVQPQPKQEWSEEDENMLDRLIKHFDWGSDYRFDKNDCDEAQEWLKSLKERYNWKPSDEQMEALKDAVRLYKSTHFDSQHYKIESLYEDLKKLREE